MGDEGLTAEQPQVRELTAVERGILEFVASTMSVGAAEARVQLSGAQHGGLAHPGTHLCFNIALPDDVPRIPQGESWPLLFDVDSSPEAPLTIEVFATDGRLSGVDLTTYGDDEVGLVWPEVSRIHRTVNSS
jgi:hypothetical protein